MANHYFDENKKYVFRRKLWLEDCIANGIPIEYLWSYVCDGQHVTIVRNDIGHISNRTGGMFTVVPEWCEEVTE